MLPHDAQRSVGSIIEVSLRLAGVGHRMSEGLKSVRVPFHPHDEELETLWAEDPPPYLSDCYTETERAVGECPASVTLDRPRP